MSKQTAVRLPDELYERLQTLAEKTGRTATFYIREAVQEHVEELEDLYLAEGVLKLRQGGDDETVSLDDLSKRLGLDD